jgi:hypothetical protein
MILLADKDLADLRHQLRSLYYSEECKVQNLDTFSNLFDTFSFNPISAISLCFLAEEYELAYYLIISL